MKKTLYSSLIIVAIFATACSGSEEKSDDTTNSSDSTEQQQNDESSRKSSDTQFIESKDANGENLSDQQEMKEENPVDSDGTKTDLVSENPTADEKINTTKASTKDISTKSVTTSVPKDDDTPSFNIHEYKKMDAFLKKYVTSSGNVNYASIKSNKSELDAIVSEFKQTSESSSWSKNQKMAFWINAYNIFTIKLIVDNYPTSSITKITAKPWDKKCATIGGTTYTLNNIETDILRKKYNEPRIHFALNCASESCPILLNKAYTASNLNSLLTSQTKKFLNDTSKNSFSEKEAMISSIFDWYKSDFGDVWAFINKYHPLDYSPKKTSYMEYSWDLNK